MTTKTYTQSPGVVGFTVPVGVTSLTCSLRGGVGTTGVRDANYYKPAGQVVGTITVAPGTVVYMHIGNNGAAPSTSQGAAAAGGYPGGGNAAISKTPGTTGGGPGGGYSDVRYPTNNVAGVKLVAAGTGGSGWDQSKGFTNPFGYAVEDPNSWTGGNATSSAGGAGGAVQASGTGPNNSWYDTKGGGTAGRAGSQLQAGHAPQTTVGSDQACGGGGGWYGGGSGATGVPLASGGQRGGDGDGGNGSNYVASGVTGSSNTAPATYELPISGKPTGGAITLTYSLPPNAPALSTPFNGANTDNSQAVVFAWTDSKPPETADYVTGAQIQYRNVGDTDWTQLATVANNGGTYTAAVGTFGTAQVEWQVRSVGHLTANYGPWSSSYFFTPINPPPAPTITAPVAGATITTSPQTVSWTQVSGQQAYEVRRTDQTAPTVVYRDSGVISAPASSYSMAFDAAARTEHVQVRVLVNNLWSPWADVSITVSIVPPNPPTISATSTLYPPAITVTVANPTGGSAPAVDHNDVYRSDPQNAEIRVATGLAANASWTDNTPAHNIVYSYRAVAVAANGAGASS